MKTQIVISNAQAVTDEWIKNDLSQIVTGPFNHQQIRILTFLPNVGKHDEKIDAILEAIRQLIAPPTKSRREIGFHVREKAPRYRARKLR